MVRRFSQGDQTTVGWNAKGVFACFGPTMGNIGSRWENLSLQKRTCVTPNLSITNKNELRLNSASPTSGFGSCRGTGGLRTASAIYQPAVAALSEQRWPQVGTACREFSQGKRSLHCFQARRHGGLPDTLG